ncbi:MAG: sigma-70 family RNA polymerase sigma factor [Candidatus Gastranaerophilales bacterium]|nr:sigma-70 family RNA polymerase sigma factor [Candidatus Gastranaerophilales bacterium]
MIKFENIIKNYEKNIRKIINSFVETDNAQDVEQEVLIKVWKNLPEYKEENKLKSWLKVITVNTCKDYVKSKQFKQKKKAQSDEMLHFTADNLPTPELKLLQNERHQKILNAINELSLKHKEIIILCDIKELTYEEISQKLNCPAGTVRSRLFNARKALQYKLRDLM